MRKYKPSPKLQYAMNWLIDHPAHMFVTGRILEGRVKVTQWQSISYKTWNEAKRLLSIPSFNDLEVIEPRHTIVVNFTEKTVTYQGRNTRYLKPRNEQSMRVTMELCKRDGYRMVSPIGGVYIFTKAIDDKELVA